MVGHTTLRHTWTWTEQIIADGIAPDVDTEPGISAADRIFFEWDTNGADTGAPNFDFHLYASIDGVTYTSAAYKTLAAAVAIDTVGTYAFTQAELGPTSLMAELDVNNANLAATEYVTLRMYAYY